MKRRIVVLISGSGSNMVALIEACRSGEVPGEVVAAFADRDCPGIQKAEGLGVDAHVVVFKDYASREDWSEALRDQVLKYEPDLVVSAGFMRILSPVFVDAFANRIINLHPALLPAFAGAHGVRDALEHGVKVAGTTVHLVDYEVDHGPILLQAAVPVHADDSEGSLHERIKAEEHRLLPLACRLMLEGRVRVEGHKTFVEEGSRGG
jgi:phosphoribosylglycinamide formyltransferase 1